MNRRIALGGGAALVAAAIALTLVGQSAIAGVNLSKDSAGRPADPAEPSLAIAPEVAADRFLDSTPASVHRSAYDAFDRRSVIRQDRLQYVAYERTYRGLPVRGGDFVVVTDEAGKVLSVSGAQETELDVATTAKVSAADAAKAARSQMTSITTAYPPRLSVLARGSGRLAYEVVLEGRRASQQSRYHVYVDATTGAVLPEESWDEVFAASGNGYYNGQVTFDTSGSGSSYSMSDPNRPGLSCGGQNGQTYTKTTNTWGNGQGTNLETACVDVMYGAQKEWDMLSAWLGRNGINGSGRGFPARVGLNEVNAYWNGSFTNFGHNRANTGQATSMDVVAHEYGHGIFQTTPGGVGSGNENGGLNESTGDIFGALTEHYANNPNDPGDYEVGEEINLTGTGPIRYMYQPSRISGHPNCYSSSIPRTEVHAAAGPQNHWFYLLAEGSNPGGGKPSSPTCDNSTVTGIGIQKAGRIFMGGLGRKTSAWNHAAARLATVRAAIELFPNSAVECATTKAAWSAISVNASASEPTCPTGGTNDFAMTLNPGTGTVTAGQAATTTVTTSVTSGSAQNVTLSASGLPSGATATFTPATIQSGSTSSLRIATSAATPAGVYQVTVLGDGAAVDRTATYSLTVDSDGGPGGPAPDISVANIKTHLNQFQTIATNNGGNRYSGRPGYTASLQYVEQRLQAAGYTVTRQTCTSCTSGSVNLIAEWRGGDANQVLMLGAHLDGVAAGPGINDNASGSAVLLEVALVLAQQNPTMTKRVRFAWWSDEEQGLRGSAYYVNQLPATERTKIKAYWNFDMVGSRNAGYFINNITTAAAAPLKAYYDSIGVSTEENVEGANRSDDASFRNAGIASSGIAAGASARKTTTQAQKWGGTANAAYDSCYHMSCDNISNVADTPLDRAADAVSYGIWNQAVSTQPASDFSLGLNPTSGTVTAGQSATTTVNTQTTSGSAQTVALSVSGLPAGATASFNPSSIQSGASSTLTVSTSAAVPAGTYPLTVLGDGTAVDRTATYTLTVLSDGGQDTFSLSLNPTSGSAAPGGSVTTTVNTQTTSGNAQTVALSVSGLPAGVTASFSPSSIQSGGSSTLTITASAGAPTGTYTLTVLGDGTAVDRTATYTLTITGSGGCGGVQAWDANTPYSPGDQVSHNGRLWNSTWYSTGAEPGAPGSWAVWADAGAC
ncbi:M20/M25/M40 family metallo-hydrolase [Micromonospora sonneratiae]|uniref:M20/M25/M40 family metallo-hydrolase n=1 Tax=Micromonospora sonneratiae TaxID=1184706 RepID=A0ABW3YRG5_9ACTN